MICYRYCWGNNSVRARFKGRRCVIVATLALGSVLLRFADNGEGLVSSRRAIRRVDG